MAEDERQAEGAAQEGMRDEIKKLKVTVVVDPLLSSTDQRWILMGENGAEIGYDKPTQEVVQAHIAKLGGNSFTFLCGPWNRFTAYELFRA